MDTDGWALPEALRTATFTTAEAAALGVGRRRLRSDRAQRLFHGLWAGAKAEVRLQQRAAVALGAVAEGAWLSHATAATLLALPLPPRLQELEHIDVTVPSPRRAPRSDGVRGRQRDPETAAVAEQQGLRMSTPAQAFVDGCDYLAFEDLVALGDGVAWEREPRATVEALVAAIDAHAGQRSHRLLLRAARSVHPRAGSRPETITRLQLRSLGAPEPWCNVPVLIDDGAAIAPDAAFWPAGLVIEVEGDHHRTDRAQWLVDVDRYNRLQRFDTEVHRVTVTTAAATRRQLEPIVRRIRERWDASRRVPAIATFFEGPPLLGSGSWLPLGR